MVPGLLLGLVLGAPPDAERVVSVPDSAHGDALARFGAAVWNLRRDRMLTAARQLEDAAKKDPDATAPLRELVHVYILLGREPDAIRIAQKVLARDPADFDMAQTLAKLLFDAGQLKEAIAAAKAAADCPIPLARAETAIGIYRDLATLCEKAGDGATAEAAMRKALALVVDRRKDLIASQAFTPHEVDRAAAECYEKLGRTLTTLARYDDAAAAFTAAKKLHTSSLKETEPAAAARLDWNLSGVYQAKGDAQSALECLDRVLRLKPQSPEPYLRLGQLLRDLGQGANVAARLQRLYDRDSDNVWLRTVLAAELARIDQRQSDELFAKAMSAKATSAADYRALMAIVIQSRLKEDRAGQIVADLDKLFNRIKDDEKEEKPADAPESAAAKALAAGRLRVFAELLREDPVATEAVLKAVAKDLASGVRRNRHTCYFIAQLAARNKKLSMADVELSLACEDCPPESKSDIYLALIEVREMDHNPAGVEAICKEALNNQKQTIAPFIYHYHRATALAELGRSEEALASIERAIQETGHSNRLAVKLQKVRILSILQKWEDAVVYANKLVEEFPALADRQEIRYTLAHVYFEAGKPDQAESLFRAILDVDPDHALACNALGYQLADQGRDLEDAERLIRRAIAVDRYDNKKSGATELENGMYLDSLAWVLFRKGKLAEARVELERAVSLSSGYNQAVIWDHLGDVLFRLGEKARAKSAWEEAKRLFERDRTAPARRNEDQLDEVKRKLTR